MRERRKFIRFPAPLKIEIIQDDNLASPGQMKDFSRGGLRGIFDNLASEPDSEINLKIQVPGQDVFVQAIGQLIWKNPLAEKCEAGLKLKHLSPAVKADILEYGYKSWLKTKESN